ncbi:MAG: PAS domain S-box protein [Gammaproteobacteria bacterium]|nr:PAS domain S-box protein [Gammaproteobacteria bacterium]
MDETDHRTTPREPQPDTNSPCGEEWLDLYRHAVEVAADEVFVMQSDSRLLYVNDSACARLGYRRDEMIGMPVWQWDPNLPEHAWPQFWKDFVAARTLSFETLHRTKHGETFPVAINAHYFERGGQGYGLALVDDLSEKRRIEQALLENQEHLKILVEFAPGALAMLDTEMRYLLVSRRWLDDYGLSGSDIIGRSHYEVFPEISEEWKAIHSRCLAGEVHKRDEDAFRRADGSIQWLRWEVRPWYTAVAGVGGILIFSEDITRLKQLEDERISGLVRAKEIAERANQEKTRFLSNMSHELRTPLHAITSLSALGIKKTGEEKSRGYFEKINVSGKRLAALLDNLIDLSSLEAGRFVVQFKSNDLTAVARSAVDQLQAPIQDKAITVRIDSHGPLLGQFDAKLILQVVLNLLSNAVQYSPRNHAIDILLGLVHDAPVDTLSFSVIDRGVGIPEGELQEVFGSFVQSSVTRTDTGGTGLGLAIAREIIALHHGRIWAESPPPGEASGTLVRFEIPAAQLPERSPD